jgi:hypothetical protein
MKQKDTGKEEFLEMIKDSEEFKQSGRTLEDFTARLYSNAEGAEKDVIILGVDPNAPF